MEVRYQLRYSPEWDSPEGDCESLTPATPRSPNRGVGRGQRPSAEAFHWVIRQPARPSSSTAQWQLPKLPSTRQAVD